jgi:zinc protease
MEDIQGFTTEDCARFYAAYYAPNNAIMVLVGHFDEEATLTLLQEHYGAIAPAQMPPHHFEAEPRQEEERVLEIEKPTPTDKLALGYKGPSLGEPDYAVLTVLNEVLTGGKSSRLYRALISEGELASDIRGSVSATKDPGLYELWASAREGHSAEDALTKIESVLDQVIAHGISESELDKAKNRLELGFLHGMETASGKAEQIGFYETVLGDAARIFQQLEAYRGVSLGDVQRVARARFDKTQRTTLFVRPSGEDGGEDNEEEAA